MPKPWLDCYACGERVYYLGRDAPSPTCPNCGVDALTPIGDIEFGEATVIDIDGRSDLDPEMFRVEGVDATGRRFRYVFIVEADENRDGGGHGLDQGVNAFLVRVVIEAGGVDVPVPLDRAVGSALLPFDALQRRVSSFCGAREVAVYEGGGGS